MKAPFHFILPGFLLPSVWLGLRPLLLHKHVPYRCSDETLVEEKAWNQKRTQLSHRSQKKQKKGRISFLPR